MDINAYRRGNENYSYPTHSRLQYAQYPGNAKIVKSSYLTPNNLNYAQQPYSRAVLGKSDINVAYTPHVTGTTTSVLPTTSMIRTYTAPQARLVGAPQMVQQTAPQATGMLVNNSGPVVERKLFYMDPMTGSRMMKVCTPEGTIKRVEVLDESQEGGEEIMNNQLDLETEGMILDAKEEFSDAVRESFAVEGYPVKIEAASDGKWVFYGGESFGALERRAGWLVNEGIVHKDRTLSTLKTLPNGDTIVNDFEEGWDLILLDSNFVEKERLEGLGDPVPGYYRMIKTRVGDDENYIIWLRGESEISIVNTYDFSARHINNFWNYRGRHVKAIAAAMDADASRLVGIGFIPGSGEIQTIHCYDGGDGVSIFEGYDVLPEVGAWLCCEVSRQGDVFFLGGAEQRKFELGDAFIVAMSFDEEAELVNYARYGEDTNFHCINVLKRHPDGNILFAGCYGYVAILLWAGEQFHLINSVPNFLDRPVTDLSFGKNILYSVCDDNKGMALYFDERYVRNRDPRGPEPPHGNFRDLPKGVGGMSLADEYRSRPRMQPKAAGMFRDYNIQRITLPKVMKDTGPGVTEESLDQGNYRVQVTPDERFVYVGKYELKVLENQAGQYRLMDNATHIKPFIDMKLLNTGELLVFDENSSDLVKYDPGLNELQRLQGVRKINLEGVEIVTTLYSGDDLVYIWMRGDGSIGLVNPNTLTSNVVTNFFGAPHESVSPFTAIASPRENKVLGLDVKDGVVMFVFLRSDQGIVRKPQSDCLGDTGTVLCMETSTDDNIFFAGGSSQFELMKGVAKIFCMTFDEDVDLICDLTLPNNIVNTSGVSDIKRKPGTDVLFCGANASLFVVEWTGSHFVILTQVEEIHSWLVNNMDCANDSVYTVSHRDNFLNRITFTP